ncbi:potassium-transporting ATPase subunit C [Actinomadura sp. ATCC 31491]|uniref:Potassium-transporting ATPase KdpC subunit n=1 Tax=Actinomadura luzonensis TaxID=2805427 RepID=A0ABT0FSB0_9ACTN|nr:potassium-transporting ATPase subunit C [Actinomadura luzonensis]MCK2215232.1 potassium-transporting ATPase subunit C [Actinomadura luzonensis]
MDRMPSWIRRHLAALRALLVLTAVTGVLYPLAATGAAQALFNHQANGSMVAGGHGSALIGQSFTDAAGHPVRKYFQSRPSAAGDGYDPTATSASNLGPEDVIDTPGRPSLLTQVCARSKAVGELEGVSGARPYCAPDGVGAVLKVLPGRAVSVNQPCPATPFVVEYQGLKVECARPGQDHAAGRTVPVRGEAEAVVPADAVTAGGSGLDPHISVAYADLQAPRVAAERGLSLDRVKALIARHTTGRALGFMGEPVVNVLELNLALDGR